MWTLGLRIFNKLKNEGPPPKKTWFKIKCVFAASPHTTPNKILMFLEWSKSYALRITKTNLTLFTIPINLLKSSFPISQDVFHITIYLQRFHHLHVHSNNLLIYRTFPEAYFKEAGFPSVHTERRQIKSVIASLSILTGMSSLKINPLPENWN